MDSNTSVDAASVQALLDSLRASTAWQNAINNDQAGQNLPAHEGHPSVDTNAPPALTTYPLNDDTLTSSAPSASAVSVASLLSQLQPTSNISSFGEYHANSYIPYVDQPNLPVPESRLPASTNPSQLPALSHIQPQDLRSCTFQQALPHLSRLSEDQGLIDVIRSMKNEQVELEKRLWGERKAIEKKHEEKVRVARNKASLIGVSLTQYEADTMTDGFRRELQKFDVERVLPAWDGLIKKQQTTLESFGVPAMYATTTAADRERQQRVVQVLANFAE